MSAPDHALPRPVSATPAPVPTAPARGSDDPTTLEVRERLSFSIGDIASNLVWTTIGSYLLFFYTDVALIAAGTAGTIMLVARLLDAFFDPAVGVVLDRTQTRWGRARPYLLFGAPLLGGLTVLTFLTPGGGGTSAVVWATATFVAVGLAYSLVNVPYGALMSMATRDSGQRMKLGAYRSFGIGLGLVVVSTATQPLVTAIGGSPTSRTGWAWVVGGYAVVSTLLIWVVFAWVKERVAVERRPVQRGDLRTSLRTLVRNKPWLSVFAFSTLSFTRLGIITAGTVFFALHVLGNPAAIPLVLTAFSVSALVGAPITPWVLRTLGHRRGINLGLVAYAVLTLALIPLQSDLLAFTAVFFVANVVGGFGFVAAPALTADTVEEQEHRSGQRSEGLLFAGYSMSTKIGAALGSALLAWGLAAVGYDPTAVTPGVATGITWIYIGLPVVVALLQVLALAPYDLQHRLPGIRAQLEARRAAR